MLEAASFFLVLGGCGWVGGGACSFVSCYCFASCFSSVSMRSDYFIFMSVVTVLRTAVCVSR